jgi:hypothetical protein
MEKQLTRWGYKSALYLILEVPDIFHLQEDGG